MGKLHKSLLENNSLYYRWHQRKFHQVVHWVAFVSVSIFITLMMVVSISGLVPDKSVANASQSFTCDFFASPTGTAGGAGTISSPWDLTTAFNKPASIIAPGKVLCLRGGTYTSSNLWDPSIPSLTMFFVNLRGQPGNNITVKNYNNERATIDSVLFLDGGQNGGTCQYVTVRNLEIIQSNPRPGPNDPNTLEAPGDAITSHCAGSKFINNVIRDPLINGIGDWAEAPDSEVYGNLIEYSGHFGSFIGSHGGNGVYAQNNTGAKLIKDNIVIYGFSLGLHIRSGGGADLNNFTVDGNTLAGNDNSGLLFSDAPSADNAVITNNNVYMGIGGNIGAEVGGSPGDSLTVTGNYFSGGLRTNYLKGGNLTHIRNNTIDGRGDLVNSIWLDNTVTPAAIDWDANTYKSTDNPQPFQVSFNDGNNFSVFTPANWKSTYGRDLTSTFSPNGNPSGIKTFVRPNTYESGRANLTIYNWDHAANVPVTLTSVNTGLSNGQTFEIRNAQNFYGAPVMSGQTFTGTSMNLNVPTTTAAATSVIPPTGSKPTPASMCPEFCAFMIIPTSAGAAADTTPPTVSISAPSGGATVSGAAVIVSANASDNVGVSGVQFKLDGANLGNEDTTSPYSISFNTTTTTNASHSLTAIARDAAGNTTTSSAVSVTVNNVVADITPPVISGVTSSNIKFKSATITWSTNEVSNTQVEYGTTTSYGSATSINTNLVTSHTSNLGNLNPGTLYHYRVKSRDAAGNLATSGDFTFTTEGRLPKPPAPASVSFSPGSVILNWTSLDYELCASINIYRDTSSAPLTPDATKLIVSLNCTDTTYRDTNVTSGTTYYYSIFVFDDLGVSSDPLSGSFKAPAVSSGGGGGGSSGGGGTSSNTKIATNTTIPGCTGSTLFSPITGQACGTNTSVKPTSRYYNFGPVTLQNGSRGEGVKELQRYLNDTLNLGLVVDGILGPKTIAVIKTWQRNHALVADGLVGRKTKAMMNGLPIPN